MGPNDGHLRRQSLVTSMQTIHFISGLPRSGSTLLAGILRQNPRFNAGMSGPVAHIFMSLTKGMSGINESAPFMSDQQRIRILRGMVENYYADLPETTVVFDTNRAWCSQTLLLAQLFPNARVICCVRSASWILDSIERHIQKNELHPPKMFNYEAGGNVYTRTEMLMKAGLVGGSMNSLRQAWFGEEAWRMIAVRYESLASNPIEVMGRLYNLLEEPPFIHDFENVRYDEPEFDDVLGIPGFHKVAPRVEYKKRRTILPPELFAQHDKAFWDMPGQNPRGVTVL